MARRRTEPKPIVADPYGDVPAGLAVFVPEEWGSSSADSGGGVRGAEPGYYAAMSQYFRARGEWRVTAGVPLTELPTRERWALQFA